MEWLNLPVRKTSLIKLYTRTRMCYPHSGFPLKRSLQQWLSYIYFKKILQPSSHQPFQTHCSLLQQWIMIWNYSNHPYLKLSAVSWQLEQFILTLERNSWPWSQSLWCSEGCISIFGIQFNLSKFLGIWYKPFSIFISLRSENQS